MGVDSDVLLGLLLSTYPLAFAITTMSENHEEYEQMLQFAYALAEQVRCGMLIRVETDSRLQSSFSVGPASDGRDRAMQSRRKTQSTWVIASLLANVQVASRSLGRTGSAGSC